MFFSFELNTLDHYDYKNHEYSTIESDIFHVLKVLSEKFTLYEYWIYKSKKRLENVEMDIPVASKKLVKKNLYIDKANDLTYYKNSIVAFDQLIGICNGMSLEEAFNNRNLKEKNFMSDLLEIVPVQIEITDSASIKITSAHSKIIRDVVLTLE